jgi:hypothetical protein
MLRSKRVIPAGRIHGPHHPEGCHLGIRNRSSGAECDKLEVLRTCLLLLLPSAASKVDCLSNCRELAGVFNAACRSRLSRGLENSGSTAGRSGQHALRRALTSIQLKPRIVLRRSYTARRRREHTHNRAVAGCYNAPERQSNTAALAVPRMACWHRSRFHVRATLSGLHRFPDSVPPGHYTSTRRRKVRR